MEPPCEHGGVSPVGMQTWATCVELQWSRRVNTAECRHLDADEPESLQLQWSRRVNTAEWVPGALPRRPASQLQWSRRVNTAECDGRLRRLRSAKRFNGAAV